MQTGMWKKLYKYLPAAGVAAVLLMGIPYLLLGQDAVVTYHDQLDGEMIAYILQAKHLFEGNTLPEFLNGASKTALMLPAPACVLLFLSQNYFGALVLMQLLGSLTGYLGMYLLSQKIVKRKWIAVAVGVLYAYLPFLPVYGLAQYGLPLLAWCFWRLSQPWRFGKKREYVFLYGYIALYTLTSSLVLVGFGVLGAGLLWGIWLYGRHSEGRKRVLTGWLLLLSLYLLENSSLFIQLLGGGEVSHKSEYALTPSNFFAEFIDGIWKGGQHSEAFQGYFFIGIGFVVLTAVFLVIYVQKKTAEKLFRVQELLRIIFGLFVWNGLLAFGAALWNSAPGIAVRVHLQAAGAFQVDRLLWLAPCGWYLMLACTAALACELWEARLTKGTGKAGAAAIALMVITLCVTGTKVLLESNLKPNLQKLRNSEYAALSYNDYYAIGVLEQVKNFLQETTGQQQEEYRVVSLGIDPAAALYHGFYCLDGYSNNYSLAYKHEFRKIITPELDKSAYLKEYFDQWGNRCYLFSAECPGYYTIEKNGFYFQNYTIDSMALRELGGKYLLSAAYIQNAQEQGLVLLREEPFETENSYYRIFLYGLDAS